MSRCLKTLKVVFSCEKYIEIKSVGAVVFLRVFCHLIIVLSTYIAHIVTYILPTEAVSDAWVIWVAMEN